MIILGSKKELYMVNCLSEILQNDIREVLKILDSNYGSNRDYLKNGGFVGIVGNFDELIFFKTNWKIDLINDISEYSIMIDGYIKKLFIINPDFAIVIYIKEDII